MPNRNYQRGVRFERDMVNEAIKKGHISARTAGSHGSFDVIDFDPVRKHLKLVQCKVKKNGKLAGKIVFRDRKQYIDCAIETYRVIKFTR